MKEYLKTNNPKIALLLIGIFFISNFLTLLIASFGEAILLFPSNLREPINWYRFLSYPLYVGGLLSWIHNSVVLYITGLIIEKRLTKKPVILIIILSVFVGGFVAILLNQGDPINRPIASPSMISWGYWSAAIVIGLFNWKSFNLFEKIVFVLLILSIIGFGNPDYGFLIGQITVVVLIGIISTIIIVKRKNRP